MKIKFINNIQPEIEITDLRGADLRGADLRGADLCRANLCGTNLRGADLCRADLCRAYLREADLHGADLRGADLRGADLCRADLRGADLHGANLREANLMNCIMNWSSHELIARRIFNETPHRTIAGLILISKDWCWNDFQQLIPTQPHTQEIITFLKSCVKPNDNHPHLLD